MKKAHLKFRGRHMLESPLKRRGATTILEGATISKPSLKEEAYINRGAARFGGAIKCGGRHLLSEGRYHFGENAQV